MHNCDNSSISLRTSHRSTHIVSNRTKEILRVVDIWIPNFARSHNHFTKFFMPEIENLFQAGNMIVRVEASSLSSQLVCWRLWQNVELQQAWQLDSSDEQIFSPLPIVFQNLIPVAKGEQQKFFD